MKLTGLAISLLLFVSMVAAAIAQDQKKNAGLRGETGSRFETADYSGGLYERRLGDSVDLIDDDAINEDYLFDEVDLDEDDDYDMDEFDEYLIRDGDIVVYDDDGIDEFDENLLMDEEVSITYDDDDYSVEEEDE